MRENAAAKARRLLVEARLTVERVQGEIVEATCRGDSAAVYRLSFDGTRWQCSCPCLTTCSHLLALQLIVVRSRP